jgi:hypothetical protein
MAAIPGSLAVSKGRRGGSIFDTPFETRHVKAPPEFELREYHRPIGQLTANTWATAGTGYVFGEFGAETTMQVLGIPIERALLPGHPHGRKVGFSDKCPKSLL